jgi:tape measure domain-containing protein
MGDYVESITYKADIDDVKRKLRQLEDAQDDAAKSSESSGGRMSQAWDKARGALGPLMTAVKAVAAVTIGAAVAAGGWGLSVAAETETAMVGFETLLGSGQAAQAFMSDLSDFAARTPFEMAGLRNSASQMLAAGLEANRVIPIMETLGDATAAMGTGEEGIAQATRALNQMAVKGKVTGEEMLQLAEAGIPAWDALASKLGVDVATAQEMVTKGQVGVNDIFAAIEEKAGPALGRVTGMMETQSQTLSGMLATLKDTAAIELGKAAAPLVDSLKDALPQITTMIGPLAGTLSTTFGALVPLILTVVGALQPVIMSVGGVVASLAMGLAPIIQRITPFIAQLVEVLANSLNGALDALLPVLGDLLASIAPLLPIIGRLAGTVLLTLADILVALLPALTPILDIFVEIADQIVTALAPVLEQLAPVFAELAAFIGPVLVEMAEPLQELITALLPPLAELLLALLPIMVPLLKLGLIPTIVVLNALNAAVVPLVTWLADRLTPAFEKLGEWTTKAGDALDGLSVEKVNEALASLWGWLQDLPAKIWALASDAAGWLVDAGADLITGFLEGTTNTISTVSTWWIGLPPMLLGWLGDATLWLVGKGTDAVGGLLQGAVNVVGTLAEWWLAMPGRLLEWLANAAGWLVQKGVDTVGGFVWGVASVAENVWSFFRNLPANIVNTIGNLGGTLLQAGKDLVDGLLSGIRSFGSTAIDWARGVAIDIANAILGPVNRAIQAINDMIPNSIGIGPVTIDLPDNPFPALPRFHSGGVVPGAPGAEVLAVLQGGERVLTADQDREITRLLAGLTAAGGGRTTIENMNVHPRGSAREWLDEGLWRLAG